MAPFTPGWIPANSTGLQQWQAWTEVSVVSETRREDMVVMMARRIAE